MQATSTSPGATRSNSAERKRRKFSRRCRQFQLSFSAEPRRIPPPMKHTLSFSPALMCEIKNWPRRGCVYLPNLQGNRRCATLSRSARLTAGLGLITAVPLSASSLVYRLRCNHLDKARYGQRHRSRKQSARDRHLCKRLVCPYPWDRLG